MSAFDSLSFLWQSAASRQKAEDERLERKRFQLRRIEIKTRKLTNQVFAGSYHSAFKGRGISFSEVREYQYGDDIRSIDWNVTARTQSPHVKVFEEERELTVMLLIDVSRSTFFGTQTSRKSDVIAAISSVLSFSALQNNDKVGALFFSDQIEQFIPPRKGKSHILRIINDILEYHPQNRSTDISLALQHFSNILRKKTIAFLISDFMSPDFSDALKITARRHDLIGLHVYDIRERLLPMGLLFKAVDLEKGTTQWVDTSDRRATEQYTRNFDQRLHNISEQFLKSGAQFESVSVGDSGMDDRQVEQIYVRALQKMFQNRGLRK
jgi:uncharacterized protein (DUF58 family)